MFAALLSCAAILTTAALPGLAAAQQPAAGAAGGAAAAAAKEDVKAILPYLDDGTFLLIRLDVDRVDPAALEQFLKTMAESVPPRIGVPADQQGRMRQELLDGIDVSKQWLADMTAAGGRRVYMLFLNTGDLQTSGGDEPLTVVPLGAGAAADRIRELLNVDLFDGRRQEPEQIGNAIVQGKPEQLARLRAYVGDGGGTGAGQTPGVHPADLAAALAAGGDDAPLRFAMVPGQAARAWMAENVPTLPEFLGGGDGKLLSRDVRWAAAALSQKPYVTATVTVKATDAAKAKALSDVLGKALAFAREQVAGMPNGDATVKQIDALNPRLAGDAITFTADAIEVQVGLMSLRTGQGAAAPAPGGAPPKPDDGGL